MKKKRTSPRKNIAALSLENREAFLRDATGINGKESGTIVILPLS